MIFPIFLIILVANIYSVTNEECQRRYSNETVKSYGDFCYVDKGTNGDVTNAETQCMNQYGGHLPTFRNSNENEFLFNFANSRSCSLGVWLGYRDDIEELVWYTPDGTFYSDYDNWQTDQPTNEPNQYYVGFTCGCGTYTGNCGAWYDVLYNQQSYHWFCQIPYDYCWETESKAERICREHLFPGETVHAFEDYCIVEKGKAWDWNVAESWCTGIGGHLPSIHSPRENDFIRMLGRSKDQSRKIHLGLKDVGTNNWEWTDATPKDYLNWRYGEPSNTGEKYVEMWTDGMWNDKTVSATECFVFCKVKIPEGLFTYSSSDKYSNCCGKNTHGPFCNITTCAGYFTNETDVVCTGHGDCTSFEHCECQENYYGAYCNLTKCEGIYSNISQKVCNSHGTCWPFEKCSCETNYYGKYCNVTTCHGKWNNETTSCGEYGKCEKYENCECDPGILGSHCNITTCFGVLSNHSDVCSRSGTCFPKDKCKCEKDYFSEFCNVTTCFGFFSNETSEVCNGHGKCWAFQKCVCDEKYYGKFCNVTICFSKLSNDTENVCAGKGPCWPKNNCKCEENYYGPKCDVTECFSLFSNNTKDVCNGHGTCWPENKCKCKENYHGPYCNETKCHSQWNNATNNPCGDYGSCIEFEKCACNSGYFGPFCNVTTCYDVLSNQTSSVCSGHGICFPIDQCTCSANYFGELCNITICFGVLSNQTDACNGKGTCWEHQKCACASDYFGESCNITSCYGTFSNSTKEVCNGHGECFPKDECDCSGIFSGHKCEIYKVYKVKDLPNQNVYLGMDTSFEVPIDAFHGEDAIFISILEKPNWASKEDLGPREMFGLENFVSGSVSDIAVSNSRMYLLNGGDKRLYVYDISNVTNPKFMKTSDFSIGITPNRFLIDGEVAYVLSVNPPGTISLVQILNISSPTSGIPVLGTFTKSGGGSLYGLDKVGEFLYFPSESLTKLFILNVTDSSSPVESTGVVTSQPGRDVKVKGNYAYVVNDDSPSLDVIDLSLKTLVTSRCSGCGSTTRIVLSRRNQKDYAVLLNHENQRIRYFDLTNPALPFSTGSMYTFPPSTFKKVSDIRMGGPDQSFVFASRYVVDFSDPMNPTLKFDLGEEVDQIFLQNNNIFTVKNDGGVTVRIWEYGSVRMKSSLQFSVDNLKLCGQKAPIKIGVRSNAGDQLNETFQVIIRGDGVGNIVDEKCTIFKCNGVFSNDTMNVCHGRGNCSVSTSSKGQCTCRNPDLFSNVSFCGGCQAGYYGEDCTVTKCNGYFSNDTSRVCSNHGMCWPSESCTCKNGNYTGNNCQNWKCFDTWNNDTQGGRLCSGHGTCEDYESCKCLPKYNGKNCEYFSCFGIDSTEINAVCAQHGACVALDICVCFSGYTPSTGKFGDSCDQFFCGEDGMNYPKYSREGCNNHGNCTLSNKCECDEGYENDLCSTWSCGGFDKSMKEFVCNGNGDCVKPNECECGTQYIGDNCETNAYLLTIMTPILTISAIGFSCFVLVSIIVCAIVVVVVIVCVFCVFFVCVFLLFCSLVCCFVCCLSVALWSQRSRLKRFGRLKNIELLLQEQELEEDTSIAHIRINKNLFEIPMKEVKPERVIGEGGSNSIVYRARWKNQVVAFKCFKTRSVFDTQDSFDEFEREVQVLGSISHPHIVRYFGSCLEHPRVGIVMEFCENGDLQGFVFYYERTNGRSYPFDEKLRIVFETANALDYLHSRSIIHRDLKLENVLLDINESSKLMDFGLSRIVDRMSKAKTKRIGTSLYMSPEIMTGNYNEKTDVYSMAMFMYILFTENIKPYGDEINVEYKVANDPNFRPGLEELEKNVPETHHWLIDVVNKSWQGDPAERLTMGEICGEIEGRIDKKKKKKTGIDLEDNVKIRPSSVQIQKTRSADGKNEDKILVEELKDEVKTLKRENKELKMSNSEKDQEIEKLRLENQELRKDHEDVQDSGSEDSEELEDSD